MQGLVFVLVSVLVFVLGLVLVSVLVLVLVSIFVPVSVLVLALVLVSVHAWSPCVAGGQPRHHCACRWVQHYRPPPHDW